MSSSISQVASDDGRWKHVSCAYSTYIGLSHRFGPALCCRQSILLAVLHFEWQRVTRRRSTGKHVPLFSVTITAGRGQVGGEARSRHSRHEDEENEGDRAHKIRGMRRGQGDKGWPESARARAGHRVNNIIGWMGSEKDTTTSFPRSTVASRRLRYSD